MNTIFLIFSREFKTRIRNRSFLIMSILGPILIAAILIVPLLLQKLDKARTKHVAIVDETYILGETIRNFDNYMFTIVPDVTVEDLRKDFAKSGYDAVLFIPKNIYSSNTCILYSNVWVDNALKAYVGYILRRDLEYMALMKENVSIETIQRVSTPVAVGVQKWTKDGTYIDEEISMTKKSAISLTASVIIYIFIFMYGVLVLRGVIEEKSSRVVEVIVSSVKPIQLMAGKILGIATIGLLQFVLWLVLTTVIVYGAQVFLFPETYNPAIMPELTETLQNSQGLTQLSAHSNKIEYAVNLFQTLEGVNWTVMLIAFVFYFLVGYLLYASLFAGVGALLDNDSDSQQFILPITIPLILSLLLLESVISNPSGDIALWLSFIPFTSPIAMMARLPFGVPYWHVIVSAAILIVSCIATTWLAAKLYSSGLLLYGKKLTLKTCFQLLRTKP